MLGNGFRYAGLKYYGVCFCGAAVGGTKTDDDQCNLPCSGDKSQTCGGNDALSIWEDPTFPTEDVPESSYAAQGCYTDDGNGRALTWPADVDSASLTPAKCISACKAQGFAYAGTEFGGECYCGTFLAKDSSKTADSECNVPCRGDGSQSCGGPKRLNVYLAEGLLSTEPCKPEPPVSSSSSTVVPTSTTKSSSKVETTTSSSSKVETTTSSSSKVETTTSSSSTVETTTSSSSTITTTTSSSSKVETTTSSSSKVETTTTSTPPPSTTTSARPTSTTSTTSKQTITTSIVPTTTKPPVTTLTTSSVCVTTTVIPPKCERQIGNWCAPPVPEWNNKIECLLASKTCLLRTSSCFLGAGLKDAFRCFEYAKFCEGIKICCLKCGLGHCKKGGCDACKPKPPGTSTTKTIPCPTTSTTTSTPTVCPPVPTNICKEGFPGKPLCGIPLPVVSCNDQKADFDANPYKLYDNVETSKCWKFPKPQLPSACSKACNQQYDACANAGLWQCAFKNKRNAIDSSAVAEVANQSANEDALQPRTFNLIWKVKCKAQLVACLKVNKWVDPKDKCKKWCPKDD